MKRPSTRTGRRKVCKLGQSKDWKIHVYLPIDRKIWYKQFKVLVNMRNGFHTNENQRMTSYCSHEHPEEQEGCNEVVDLEKILSPMRDLPLRLRNLKKGSLYDFEKEYIEDMMKVVDIAEHYWKEPWYEKLEFLLILRDRKTEFSRRMDGETDWLGCYYPWDGKDDTPKILFFEKNIEKASGGDPLLKRHLYLTTFIHELLHAYFDVPLDQHKLYIPKVEEGITECGVLKFLWDHGYREDFLKATSLIAREPQYYRAGITLFREYPECVEDFKKNKKVIDSKYFFFNYEQEKKGIGNRQMGFDFQGMSDDLDEEQGELVKNNGLNMDLTFDDFGIELTCYDFIQSFSPILSEDGKKLIEKYRSELDGITNKVRNYFLELECNSDIFMLSGFYKAFGDLKDEVIKSRMQSYCNRDNCFGYSLMKGERPPKINGDEELEKHLFRIAFMQVLIFSYFVFHREMREFDHPKIWEDIVACGVLEFLWYNGYREEFSLAVSLMAKKPLPEQAGLILFFEYPECVKDFRKRARFMTDGESVFSSYKPGEKGSGEKLKQILHI